MHVHASQAIVEALIENLLTRGLRPAGPGEFTARAYLNGKLDLAQAEAVNEVISSSNHLQLDAAQRLLSGRLTKTADDIRGTLLDALSLIEAGLDFSGDIEFISIEQAVKRLTDIEERLDQLLAGSIRCEMVMDLPAAGIAGAPNAGKSSLLNALLGWERSIVSNEPKTTRDVLTGLLTTDRLQCVLFDCAGLIPVAPPPSGVSVEPSRGRLGYIDDLAQHAALEALRNCHVVLFCVDLTKTDWSEDVAIRALIQPRELICVATKSDLLRTDELPDKLSALSRVFNADFLPTSAETSHGLDSLLDAVEANLPGWATPTNPSGPAKEGVGGAVLVARHRQAIVQAMDNVREAIKELPRGNEEVAVTMLRAACQSLSQIEQQPIDEQVLDRIFSRFCIGK
ncbi:MAG: 50S ribosome-binding GTPase [Sedimentisphaerales bacterium]|nr:50S ribosome-binding GTPase [Sedimentisphaerales bacterium]